MKEKKQEKKEQSRVLQVTVTGLMAALVFVASMIQVPVPISAGIETRLHLGNVFCLLAGLKENLPYRNARSHNALSRYAGAGKFLRQLFVRNHIHGCLGLGYIRAAGVICGDKVVLWRLWVIPLNPPHNQAGKHMGAND